MQIIENITAYVIPALLVVVGVLFFSNDAQFDKFIEGAVRGIEVSVKLLPTLILLLVGVNMFCTCGILEPIGKLMAPIFCRLGIPSEAIPLLLLRPISGSASLAMASDLFSQLSPDSYAGYFISVVMGSSDTMLYVNAVYLSSVGIKHGRHALLCSTLTLLFCIFISSFICRIFYA